MPPRLSTDPAATRGLPFSGGVPAALLSAHNSRLFTNAICLPILFLIISATLCFLLLSLNYTYISVMLNDTFVIIDGAYRMAQGYIPHVDFRTQLGFLNFAFPALAMLITDNVGAAVPTALALYVLFLSPLAAYVICTRMRYWIAIPLFLYIVFLVASPFMVGSTPVQISFASIYNKVGWAALLIVLLMYIAPIFQARKLWIFDALVASLLIAFLLYTKITYGLVAAAAVVLMAILNGEWRRRAILGALLFVAIIGVVELALGINYYYFSDLAHHSLVRTSLGFMGTKIIASVVKNSYYVIAGLSAVILCYFYSDRKYQDVLFGLFVISSSVVLFIFNGQETDIPTVIAFIAIACERIARYPSVRTNSGPRVAVFAVFSLFLIMISQIFLYSAVAFGLNYTRASAENPKDIPGETNIGSYFVVEDWPHGAFGARMKQAIERFGEDGFDEIRKYVVARQSIFQQEYFRTIEQGVVLLDAYDLKGERILTFDFANPFPLIVGSEPPTGDRVGLYFGRTFNEDVYIPADSMFRDAGVVMVPKVAIEPHTRDALMDIYGDYLRDHYRLIHDDRYWSVWKARNPKA